MFNNVVGCCGKGGVGWVHWCVGQKGREQEIVMMVGEVQGWTEGGWARGDEGGIFVCGVKAGYLWWRSCIVCGRDAFVWKPLIPIRA